MHRPLGDRSLAMEAYLKSYADLPLSPVVVVLGPDPFWLHQVVSLFKDRALGEEFAEMNDSSFVAGETPLEQVLQACRDFPCFAERRVVWLKDAGRIKKKESKFLIDYLQSPPETTLLLISDAKLDGRLDWVKKLKKNALWVQLNPLDRQGALSFLQGAFRDRNLDYDEEVLDALVEALGTQLGILSQTVEQLATYLAEGERLTLEAATPFLKKVSEENIFEVIEATFTGDQRRLSAGLEHLLQSGEAPLKILTLLYRHLSILLSLQNSGEAETRQVFRLPPFIIKNYQQQVRRFGAKLQLGLLGPLVATDHALKHSGLPAPLILKQGLSDLVHRLNAS